jgi:hypothetical protein
MAVEVVDWVVDDGKRGSLGVLRNVVVLMVVIERECILGLGRRILVAGLVILEGLFPRREEQSSCDLIDALNRMPFFQRRTTDIVLCI